MIKAFIDANVFFSAAKSIHGGSALILTLAKKGIIKIVTVNHALIETERNISNKLNKKFLLVHYQNIFDAKKIFLTRFLMV